MSTPRIHPAPTIDLAGPRTITADGCRRWILCGLVLMACTATPALEIHGDPPVWLTKTITPVWRLTPLEQVFDDLAKAGGITIARPTLTLAHNEQPVLLSTAQAVSVREALVLLERCAPIRFTVNAGTLTAHDAGTFDQRRSEIRWYHLSDYSLVDPARHAVHRPFGLPEPQHGASASPPFATRSVLDPEQVIEYVRKHVAPASWEQEGFGISLRGSSLVIVHTPEVHTAINATLSALKNTFLLSKRWQVSFGLLPKDERIATGIVTSAQAKAVDAQLTGTVVLTLSGQLGQQVHAASADDRAHLVDLDVVNYRPDPKTGSVKRGRSATLSTLDGRRFSLVSANFAWVEDAEPTATSEIRSPVSTAPLTTITSDTGEKTMGPAPQLTAGDQIRLELPVLWTWRPNFEVFLPHGSALIISSEHPRGQAVMVLEELP